jgi:hypothetical protein
MSNLYSATSNQEANRYLFGGMGDTTGNLPAMPGVYPDYRAPNIRNGSDGSRGLAPAR